MKIRLSAVRIGKFIFVILFLIMELYAEGTNANYKSVCEFNERIYISSNRDVGYKKPSISAAENRRLPAEDYELKQSLEKLLLYKRIRLEQNPYSGDLNQVCADYNIINKNGERENFSFNIKFHFSDNISLIGIDYGETIINTFYEQIMFEENQRRLFKKNRISVKAEGVFAAEGSDLYYLFWDRSQDVICEINQSELSIKIASQQLDTGKEKRFVFHFGKMECSTKQTNGIKVSLFGPRYNSCTMNMVFARIENISADRRAGMYADLVIPDELNRMNLVPRLRCLKDMGESDSQLISWYIHKMEKITRDTSYIMNVNLQDSINSEIILSRKYCIIK